MTSRDAIFFEFEDPGALRASYLICSIPRSGSNLLCGLLSGTGLAGAPTELFHPDIVRLLKRHWSVETTDEYVAELLARKTGPNGVFGAKAHWGQYHPLFGEADPREILPHLTVIYITRRDHLRQAISWVRALQTLRWQSNHATRPDRAVEFDAGHITRKLGRIGREEDAWRALFDRYAIDPHEIVYEDFIADQAAVIRDVLALVGVEPPSDIALAQPPLTRQSDDLSDQWVDRYLAETRPA